MEVGIEFIFIIGFCNNPIQILCCNEIFCEEHLKKELTATSTPSCPKCKEKTSLNNYVPNKRLEVVIELVKSLLNGEDPNSNINSASTVKIEKTEREEFTPVSISLLLYLGR